MATARAPLDRMSEREGRTQDGAAVDPEAESAVRTVWQIKALGRSA